MRSDGRLHPGCVIVQYSGDELLLQLNVIKVSQRGREKKVPVVLEHIVKIIAIGL